MIARLIEFAFVDGQAAQFDARANHIRGLAHRAQQAGARLRDITEPNKQTRLCHRGLGIAPRHLLGFAQKGGDRRIADGLGGGRACGPRQIAEIV